MASNELPGLSVKISVDSSGVDQGVNNTESKLKGLRGSVNQAAKDLTKYAGVAAAAGAALSVHLAIKSAAAAKEIQNLARVANSSIQDFQKYAFAAKTVGIEQDKFADILKDVNDRVGDFLITGGGPMLDFFETIAPKVGVTAEAFKGLSGPQALQLYVETLEKANVSQQQFTFFMEAMASDSTLLLPLLKDNARALQEQAERAEKLGLVMSDIDNAKLVEMGEAINRAGDLAGRTFDGIAAQAAPVVTALIGDFEEMVISVGGFEQFTKNAFNNIIDAAGFVADSVQKIEQGFGISANGIVLAVAQVQLELSKTEVSMKRLKSLGGLIDVSGDMQELLELQNQLNNVIDQAGAAIDDLLNQEPASKTFKKYVDLAKDEGENAGISFAEGMRKGMDQSPVDGNILTEQDNSEIQAILDRGKTELELRREQKENELALLDEKYKGQAQKDEDYYRLKRAIEGSFIEDKRAMQEAEAMREQAINAQRVGAVKTMFSDLSTLMNSGSKKQFEIGKKAAMAQTVISTYEGAQKAYTALAGIPVVGPALGAAAAAAAIVAGNVRLQAIRGQSFGGGSAAAGSGGGVAGAIANASNPAVGNGSSGPTQTIQISGLDPSALYSGESFNNLLEKINEAGRDGRVLITTG